MQYFNNTYQNRRVLITGHTGFKGSWLSLWLKELGAELTGMSLLPDTEPNHWNLLKLDFPSYYVDIRNKDSITKILKAFKPQLIFHLAAQPLVRRSYLEPLETWMTNVIGTANLLETCRTIDSLGGIIIVTSDKCYENKEKHHAYCEIDSLGGHDPYSASKAATELVAISYRKSFFNSTNSPLLATARAGNVIGGGDWSCDRLIPDLVRTLDNHSSLEVRHPAAIRPWQHVLESLSGYLLLGQQCISRKLNFADAWNFGPDKDDHYTVHDVLTTFKKEWPILQWHHKIDDRYHEAKILQLDNRKARQQLNWIPIWSFDECIQATAQWYKSWIEEKKVISLQQIQSYSALAHKKNAIWTRENMICEL